MQRYVSLLRGINVSGQKKIKMDDLVALYETLGLANVCTYIQSGNVAFDADTRDTDRIGRKIEQAIQQDYGFTVPVLLRTRAQMDNTIKANPFLRDNIPDISKVHVTFLERPPEESVIQDFNPSSLGQDRFAITGTDVYLYCPGGYGKTKLSNNFIEKQLGVRATTRNWKTVRILADMVHGAAPSRR